MGLYDSGAAGRPQFFDGLGGFLNAFPRHFPEATLLAKALR
jgi:hypothetical protein